MDKHSMSTTLNTQCPDNSELEPQHKSLQNIRNDKIEQDRKNILLRRNPQVYSQEKPFKAMMSQTEQVSGIYHKIQNEQYVPNNFNNQSQNSFDQSILTIYAIDQSIQKVEDKENQKIQALRDIQLLKGSKTDVQRYINARKQIDQLIKKGHIYFVQNPQTKLYKINLLDAGPSSKLKQILKYDRENTLKLWKDLDNILVTQILIGKYLKTKEFKQMFECFWQSGIYLHITRDYSNEQFQKDGFAFLNNQINNNWKHIKHITIKADTGLKFFILDILKMQFTSLQSLNIQIQDETDYELLEELLDWLGHIQNINPGKPSFEVEIQTLLKKDNKVFKNLIVYLDDNKIRLRTKIPLVSQELKRQKNIRTLKKQTDKTALIEQKKEPTSSMTTVFAPIDPVYNNQQNKGTIVNGTMTQNVSNITKGSKK